MHKSEVLGGAMIVVGVAALVLLASFVVSVILLVLELLAVVVAFLMILAGIALFVGGRWWGRIRQKWGGIQRGARGYEFRK